MTGNILTMLDLRSLVVFLPIFTAVLWALFVYEEVGVDEHW